MGESGVLIGVNNAFDLVQSGIQVCGHSEDKQRQRKKRKSKMIWYG